MKKLLILGAAISLFAIACTGQPDSATDANASAGSKAGGGSAAHIDSLKTIGTGVNGESSNTLSSKDTIINGHSVAMPADSAKKKQP